MFSKEKYKYLHYNGKTIALSTYAGKTVKGIAKCSPADDFDADKGEDLAAARCNLKVAEKRWKNANDRMAETIELCDLVDKMYDEATSYYEDSTKQLEEARNHLAALLEKM